jgi:hypothetical protein
MVIASGYRLCDLWFCVSTHYTVYAANISWHKNNMKLYRKYEDVFQSKTRYLKYWPWRYIWRLLASVCNDIKGHLVGTAISSLYYNHLIRQEIPIISGPWEIREEMIWDFTKSFFTPFCNACCHLFTYVRIMDHRYVSWIIVRMSSSIGSS